MPGLGHDRRHPVPVGGRLPPPSGLQHLEVQGRRPAARRRGGAAPHRARVSDPARARRCLPPAEGRRLADPPDRRPRHARGDLHHRPGRQRRRADVGPAGRSSGRWMPRGTSSGSSATSSTSTSCSASSTRLGTRRVLARAVPDALVRQAAWARNRRASLGAARNKFRPIAARPPSPRLARSMPARAGGLLHAARPGPRVRRCSRLSPSAAEALEHGHAELAEHGGGRLAAAKRPLVAAQDVAPRPSGTAMTPSPAPSRTATATSTSPPRVNAQTRSPASSGS